MKLLKAGADFIVAHHPMIFSSIKKITDENSIGRKILTAIQHGIAVFAMHTNCDIHGGMSSLAADYMGLKDTEVLELTTDTEGIGRIGVLDQDLELDDLARRVKKAFDLDTVVVYGDSNKKIHRIAISPGSGRSMLDTAIEKNADVLITGDFGHHEGLDAVDAGISVIDASHAGIERIFIDYISKYIEKELGESVEIIKKDINKTIPGRFV